MAITLPNSSSVTFADTNPHDVFLHVDSVDQRIIANTSTNGAILWLSQGKDAAVGVGVPIAPGGVYQETVDPTFKPEPHRWSIVSSVAGGTAATQERCS